MSGFALSGETRQLRLNEPFRLESGETIPDLRIAFRTWGRLSPDADNAVIVCHALTGSADADEWWAPLFGPGRVLDPERHFIVCSNVLGGCYGSTGPLDARPDGGRWGVSFPRITIRDQVRAQMALADRLGILGIRFVIGGSMGGLQALEWALLDPERVGAVISLAASGRHSPWCRAWSEAQRMALATDPRYRNGAYALDEPPVDGLAAARAIAMISYRSPLSLSQRFGDDGRRAEPASVNAWLRHHGQSLVERFDANSYRTLLDAMDSHDLGRGRGGYEVALRRLWQPTLIVSIDSDALYVPAEQQELARLLPDARLLAVPSTHGHDGFLIDADEFAPALRDFVDGLPDWRPLALRRAIA